MLFIRSALCAMGVLWAADSKCFNQQTGSTSMI